MPWLRKYNGSVVYVERDGVGGWFEVPEQFWPKRLPTPALESTKSGVPAPTDPRPMSVGSWARSVAGADFSEAGTSPSGTPGAGYDSSDDTSAIHVT